MCVWGHNWQGLWERVTDLKARRPSLKVMLSLGGWTFNDRPATWNIFSDMAASEAHRHAFLQSAIALFQQYRFDGLDLDWEYPGATWHGGRPEDKANFVTLVAEARAALTAAAAAAGRAPYLLTMAAGVGKANVDNGYDIAALAPPMDFINLMTYDMHGAWEATMNHHAPLHAGESTAPFDYPLSVEWAVDYWIAGGCPASKLVLGLAAYGRGYRAAHPTQLAFGDAAAGPSPAAAYTREAGMLAYYEVPAYIRLHSHPYIWSHFRTRSRPRTGSQEFVPRRSHPYIRSRFHIRSRSRTRSKEFASLRSVTFCHLGWRPRARCWRCYATPTRSACGTTGRRYHTSGGARPTARRSGSATTTRSPSRTRRSLCLAAGCGVACGGRWTWTTSRTGSR